MRVYARVKSYPTVIAYGSHGRRQARCVRACEIGREDGLSRFLSQRFRGKRKYQRHYVFGFLEGIAEADRNCVTPGGRSQL